jgi:hypothetical protein
LLAQQAQQAGKEDPITQQTQILAQVEREKAQLKHNLNKQNYS